MGRSIHVPRVGHQAPIPLAARVGPLLASSGIAGKDPATGVLPPDGATQVAHAFANLRAVLAAGGATLDDVVKLSITVADDTLRSAINTEWLACFPDPDDRPARHVVVHPLQHGIQLQLELLAFVQPR
ncbi:MAG: RidA family protein [Ideonella sp.]|nr:RidA family protein [Ideonella sp.]